ARPTACCGDAKRPAVDGSAGFRSCIFWITCRCGGKNAFGARIPTLSVPRPLRRFVVIHNCCVLCRLSGCLDKVVVSVGRRSPPLTTTDGRDLPRGSAKGGGSDEHGR